MSMTTYDLKEIAKSGGSISIDSSGTTTYDLKEIAQCLHQGGVLIIRDANKLTTYDLKEIAKVAPSKVIFEF